MPRVLLLLILIIAAPVATRARDARINPVPFAHTPCSVLDNQPCTPSFCSIYGPWPCIPEMDYPYGQNLQLTIESRPSKDQEGKYQRPDHDLDTIGDLFAELRSCWTPPPEDSARAGMQMTVRFSFKKTGEMVAPPRLTFATSGVSADTRATYLKAINASLDGCLPLKLTPGLAGALAGRPIAIRYVDNRDLKNTSLGQ